MKPNNFPREGSHSIVTKNAVELLQQQRPVLNADRHYTIGGDTEAIVHSNASAEREAAITNGARRLGQSSHDLKTGFQSAKPDKRTEYIRQQRQAASQQTRLWTQSQ